jgi:hypothetical protein
MTRRKCAVPADEQPVKHGNGKLLPELQRWLMQNPAMGIDALLSRPIESMRMCADVAERMELLTKPQIVALRNVLDSFDPPQVNVVNHICTTAMNQRKQGKLKLAISKRVPPRKERSSIARAR